MKPIMIPAAAPFLTLFQNNHQKRRVLIAQLLQRYQMETNVYSKAKFYRWYTKISKMPIFSTI
jgi:hypothetical protein